MFRMTWGSTLGSILGPTNSFVKDPCMSFGLTTNIDGGSCEGFLACEQGF